MSCRTFPDVAIHKRKIILNNFFFSDPLRRPPRLRQGALRAGLGQAAASPRGGHADHAMLPGKEVQMVFFCLQLSMAGILVHIVRFIYIAVADKHTSHLELSCYLLLLCVRSQVKLSHLFILVFNFSIACI